MINALPSSQNAITSGATVNPVSTQPTTQPTTQPRGRLNSHDVEVVPNPQRHLKELHAASAVCKLGTAIGTTGALFSAIPVCVVTFPTAICFTAGFGVWTTLTCAGSLISGCIGAKLAYKKGCCESLQDWSKDGWVEFKQGIKDIRADS